MTLLLVYIFIAVFFSFLCSIAEAALLSVDSSYLAGMERKGKAGAQALRKLKENISEPLAIILTLNTIAHTVGAAGVGAQATIIFGSAYQGFIYAVLTLIILVFSEIIPKALGATYWRRLAPVTAIILSFLIKVLYPFVVLSNMLTKWFSPNSPERVFNRNDFAALADVGEQEGELDPQEAKVLRNLFLLGETPVRSAMTPHSVMFSMPAEASCADYVAVAAEMQFSRVPLIEGLHKYVGFVLSSDVLLAYANGEGDKPLIDLSRELPSVLDKFSLLKAFEDFAKDSHHIKLVVNEYGDAVGLLTLEDVLESLIGLDIVDETDSVANMQQLAKRIYRKGR